MGKAQSLPPVADIQRLSKELLADPLSNVNNIVSILKYLSAEQPKETVVAAVRCLKVFFLDAYERGDLLPAAKARDADDARKVYRGWLHQHHAAYRSHLLSLIEEGAPPAVQVAATAALLEAVRGEEGSGRVDNDLLAATVSALVCSKLAAADAISYFITTFLPHADVRYYTLRALAKVADKDGLPSAPDAGGAESDEDLGAGQEPQASHRGARARQVTGPDLARSIYDVLANIPALSAEEGTPLTSWCGAEAAAARGGAENAQKRRKRRRLEAQGGGGDESAGGARAKWASGVLQRRAWSDAWLALLRMPLPQDPLKKVLVRAHADVVPHLADPHLLADFLTRALDAGGLPGMLALHGLFALVTRHGLEYPRFYARLYGLLTPAALLAKQRARFLELADVFLASEQPAKQRARFLELADVFLASGLVPAYTAAAFAKRFARLALTASPAGAMLCIAFVHNLLRRHPACNVLLHRPSPKPPAAAAAAPQAGKPAAGAEPQKSSADEDAGEGGHAAAASQEQNGGPEVAATPAAAGLDPYLPEEEDPAESRAIDSSLWEMDSLRTHYCPQVAMFAAVLDKDLSDRKKTAEVDMAPLRGGSYASMLTGELSRRLKRVPTAFYAERPARLLAPEACARDFVGWSLD